jgi:esterase
VQLSYQQQGPTDTNQPPVVLLHGLFGSKENLNGIARSLHEHTNVIAIDLPNHGQSFHIESFDYPMMAQAVINLMDQLDIPRFDILGHSMGGKVAMQIAFDHPERVNKLIVADMAPAHYDPQHNTVLDALSSLELKSVTSRKQADEKLTPLIEEAGVRSFLLRSFDSKNHLWRFNLPAIVDNYSKLTQGFSEQKFNGPTLFIKGELSAYIQAKHKEIIIKHFPNSRAHVIGGAGHWLHAQKPQQFNRVVQRFLFS